MQGERRRGEVGDKERKKLVGKGEGRIKGRRRRRGKQREKLVTVGHHLLLLCMRSTSGRMVEMACQMQRERDVFVCEMTHMRVCVLVAKKKREEKKVPREREKEISQKAT